MSQRPEQEKQWRQEVRKKFQEGELQVVETKKCFSCQVIKPSSEFYVSLCSLTGLSSNCKACTKKVKRSRYKGDSHTKLKNNRRNKQGRSVLRDLIFGRYGEVCVACGEDDRDVLCIDHIGNNGNGHRRKLGISGGTKFYYWLKKEGLPDGYQTLCVNCNWSKHKNGGIIPEHRLRRKDCLRKECHGLQGSDERPA